MMMEGDVCLTHCFLSVYFSYIILYLRASLSDDSIYFTLDFFEFVDQLGPLLLSIAKTGVVGGPDPQTTTR